MPKIRAIIFDIGGVLVGFKEEAFVKEILACIPRPGQLTWGKEASELYRRYELGEFSPEEFYKALLPFMKQKISFKEFEWAWSGEIFVWMHALVDYIKKLKQNGHKIALLSNIGPISYNAIIKHYDLQPFLDAKAPSYKVHARKPDKKIFDSALKQLNEKPENCVYIDDFQEFVDAAKSLGFQAIRFTSLQELKGKLQKLGVKAE